MLSDFNAIIYFYLFFFLFTSKYGKNIHLCPPLKHKIPTYNMKITITRILY